MMTRKVLIFSKQASKDDLTLTSEHLFLCNSYDAGACCANCVSCTDCRVYAEFADCAIYAEFADCASYADHADFATCNGYKNCKGYRNYINCGDFRYNYGW